MQQYSYYVLSPKLLVGDKYELVSGRKAEKYLIEHGYEFVHSDDSGCIHGLHKQQQRFEHCYLYRVTEMRL